MDFRLAEKIISARFQLRDRENPDEIVDFLPNPAQHRLLAMCQRLFDEKRPMRIISVKSRRIGFSRIVEAIACCFMFAYANFEGRVMAHYDETAMDLMSSAALMVYGDGEPGKGIPQRKQRRIWAPDEDYKYVVVPHSGRKGSAASRLLRASAKVKGKGRGLGFSFFHGSEAAYYPADSPFSAILPTLAKSKARSFGAIESTGNGQVGDGEAFYKYWQQASEIDKPGDSDWVKFFVPWTEDPHAVSNQIPKDIGLKDDEEKVLLKAGLTKYQVAWRRHEIATTYQGIVEEFNVENPLEPNDAFRSSGFPAFAYEEQQYATASVREPLLTAELERTRDPWVVKLSPMGIRGRIKIWELPQPRMEYYIGVDLCRGEDETERPGDFAAIVVINGSTGEQASAFTERMDPSKMADLVDKLGRFYRTPQISPSHCALLNIEVNANLGAECQRVLRDRYAYPAWRFARWRGSKDDRYNRKVGNAIGWETTGASRKLMFAAFRSSLREKAVCVRDSAWASQICAATMDDGRFEVTIGHDDILLAGLMAWIARQQFPPQTFAARKDIPEPARPYAEFDIAGFPMIDELSRSEGKEHEELLKKKRNQRDPLQGVLGESTLG